MSIIETTLIFAGIPAAVIVLIYGAVYAGGARRNKRYRPGRPFDFTPVWFLSAPEQLAEAAKQRELAGATDRPGLTAGPGGSGNAAGWSTDPGQSHSTGGASDRW